MAKFDEDMPLDHLPPVIYKELVNKLNYDFNCCTLETHIKKKFDEYETHVAKEFDEHTVETMDCQSITTPAENILSELSIKMCTVGILCTLLKECKLDSVWPILYHPEPSIIVKHPSDDMESNTLTVIFGQTLNLSCKATGIPFPSYQWCHNNIELCSQAAKEPEFDITIYSHKQAGEYNCKISQVTEDGRILSPVLLTKSVFVTITNIPVVIQQQPPTFLEVKEGEDFIITCMAHGHPEPCYQWFRDNTMLQEKTSNVLHIKQFNFNHEGKYYCYISNSVNEVITQKTHVMIEHPREKAIAKIALIIANDEYKNLQYLTTPRYDAKLIGNLLKDIDFEVMCFLNLSLKQMRNAIKIFSEVLTKGVYGLFYYCGHGFKMQESHMLAVDTPKSFLRKDSICESELLAMLQQNNPTLLVTILDMCQTVPKRECNPEIYKEIPEILETNINYRSREALRNLVQAYSTSSYRPSYERRSSAHVQGLYAKHLSKYISKNIPVIKVFEEVGRSIDKVLKGTERNQIPMFSVTITKSFRLTDAIRNERNPLPMLTNLNKLIAFSKKSFEIRFSEADVTPKVTISLMEPYLNVLKVSVYNLGDLKLDFLIPSTIKPNSLFYNKQNCYIFEPQIYREPLIIKVSKNGTSSLEKLHIQEYIPLILKILEN